MCTAKGLVAELTFPHAQSIWESRRERLRAAGLAACCNYISKKKKNSNNVYTFHANLFGTNMVKVANLPWLFFFAHVSEQSPLSCLKDFYRSRV